MIGMQNKYVLAKKDFFQFRVFRGLALRFRLYHCYGYIALIVTARLPETVRAGGRRRRERGGARRSGEWRERGGRRGCAACVE